MMQPEKTMCLRKGYHMSTHKPVLAALCALALAATWNPSNAQVRTSADTARTPWRVRTPSQTTSQTATAAILADSALIRRATTGNLLEVRLGELAEDRATNSAVKTFASRMVKDHGSMQKRWEELVGRSLLRIKPALGPAEESEVSRLSGLSGAAFDQAYMTTMIRNHENDVSTFQRLGPSAQSADVRNLASESVTAMQEHLTNARQVGSQVGISGPVATNDRSDTNRTGNFRIPRSGDRTSDDARRDDERRNDRGDLASADRAFVREMVADHGTQIRLAERAQREARNDDTKRFARQLASDFEKWGNRWANLADQNELKLSKGLGKHHQDKVERLEKASKNNVDRVYATTVIEHLESIVPYFQKEGRSADLPAIRRLANEELPVIREYLAKARRLEGADKLSDAKSRR